MSKMGELYLEKCIDFERLHETSMQWNIDAWFDQANLDRFINGKIDFSHRYIYWFENYACLMAARGILDTLGEDYSEIFDTVVEQWCMTTTYQDLSWLG
jgi:hypothetical protein